MAEVTAEVVEKALAGVEDLNLQQDLVSAGVVKDIKVDGASVAVTVELGYPAESYRERLTEQVKGAVTGIAERSGCGNSI